ncbi:MAG: hypothetical protein LBP67_04805 [Bacteroidales bacterium]|jgi:hypothetical protein|nr:hypothetical protein [Bacteroidales bacterium]
MSTIFNTQKTQQLKKVFLILFLFSAFVSSGQVSTNQFQEDLDFIYENLKKSASYQTQKDKHSAVQSKYEELKQENINSEPDIIESYIKFYELIDQLVDNHNSIKSNTKSFSYKDLSDNDFLYSIKSNPEYNFYPKVKINLDSLEASLSTRKINDYEGIYYKESHFKIAIFKNEDNLLQGVVLETTIPSWERGETILYLSPKGNNRFRIFTGTFIDKRLISSIEYFKDGTFKTFKWEKQTSKEDFYNADYPTEMYVINKINDSFTYVKLGTFNSSNDGIKQSKEFYDKISNSLKTENLIVDIRNNRGGGDKNSKKFYQLFKKFNGKIYLLTNYYTSSNAEQFTLKMKSLDNVTVLGDRTSGIITYGRNYPKEFETPSKRFKIHFSDLKDNWSEYLQYENVGIEPDIYLESDSDWVETIVKQYGR